MDKNSERKILGLKNLENNLKKRNKFLKSSKYFEGKSRGHKNLEIVLKERSGALETIGKNSKDDLRPEGLEKLFGKMIGNLRGLKKKF